jgi:hypothetical protein
MNKTLEYVNNFCRESRINLLPIHLKTINGGHRFRVYRNLHKNCFSIQTIVRGFNKTSYKVIGHSETIFMYHCKFKVLEVGRERVVKEKRKNVHAYVMPISIEKVDKTLVFDVTNLREIYYNPYEHKTFVYKDSGVEVSNVICVLGYKNKLYHYEVEI